MSVQQRIIFPWETRKWPDLKAKIQEPINSVVDMDSRVVSVSGGKIKPRMLMELFSQYHGDDAYASERVPMEIIIRDIVPML